MNRLLRRAQTPPVVLTTILALGLLVGWLFMYAAVMMVGSIFMSGPAPNEQLVIRRNGQVYVTRNGGRNDFSFRTLDGQPISPEELFVAADQAAVPEMDAAEKIFLGDGKRGPTESDVLSWLERIAGFRDRTPPPTFWYEVHDADPIGFVYYEGFDSQTKSRVGYVGRKGFRPDMPPVEDQIADVPGGGYPRTYAATYAREPDANMLGASLVFINSGGKLLAFDAARRSIEEIALPGSVISMAEYQTTASVSPASGEAGGSASTQVRVVNTAIRMADAVAILDGRGNNIRMVPIPVELREKAFNLYLCTASVAVFETGAYPAWHELYWGNDNGELTRRADVRLLGQPTTASPRRNAWNGIAMMPVPALAALGTVLLKPLSDVKFGISPDFRSALERSLSDAWPPLVAITILVGLLAALVYRRHRRVSDRGAFVWTVFVFLSGLPGVLAYWVHRSWPATEKCPACSAAAPRDRESCLACGAEFPLPAPAGYEIYA
ncbi:MAG: hypothetical protein HYX69_15515 [Planctomycetia bacterium]|nr:hypothetical protein [Planctomycetia bacterium]